MFMGTLKDCCFFYFLVSEPAYTVDGWIDGWMNERGHKGGSASFSS